MIKRVDNQKGLTVVELMISTAVFSTVLLVILTAITQIGRMYYKGIISSKTQNSARSIIERVTQDIQYSSASEIPRHADGSSYDVDCVGKSRYFYAINQQNTEGSYGLWTDESATGSELCSNPTAIALAPANPRLIPGANSRDLLDKNMRILEFNVTENPAAETYTVTVRVAYGDTDLLNQDNGVAASYCRGNVAGTQFCAVSGFSSTVKKRL